MDIILVPGFWLDASSWEEVTPPLTAAGHKVHPLTLPGLESADAPRAGIGLRTHIDAVVAKIDSFDAPVVLVGHSGGGRSSTAPSMPARTGWPGLSTWTADRSGRAASSMTNCRPTATRCRCRRGSSSRTRTSPT